MDPLFVQLDLRARANGWSTREVARRAGLSHSTLSLARKRNRLGSRALVRLLHLFPDLAPYVPRPGLHLDGGEDPVTASLRSVEVRLAALEAATTRIEAAIDRLAWLGRSDRPDANPAQTP